LGFPHHIIGAHKLFRYEHQCDGRDGRSRGCHGHLLDVSYGGVDSDTI
jgi:hypothetical protein